VTVSPIRSLVVLSYHKIGSPPSGRRPTWFYIPKAIFLEQLTVLQEMGWHVLDLDGFYRGLERPGDLPERSALLTFDDACRSIRGVALRCLQRFGYPAVAFVPTDYIGKTNSFDEAVEPEEPICDWNDLREIHRAGISVQSHGASHRRLSELNDAEVYDELARSKATLERGLGGSVTAFAYAYGDSGIDLAAMGKRLAANGYRAGFRYGGGVIRLPPGDRFHLPRLAVGPDTNLRQELTR
jgi:peptidoglycan/xylan/chitin deacetylase (PgdA/CDA1 family)